MRIENNTGQVPGLPPNPRITNPAKLDKLVESIKQDPRNAAIAWVARLSD